MTELDGVYAKLDRARFHARDLQQRIERALHPDLQDFVRDLDGDSAKYVYRINRLPLMDPDWSLILGDILTNLRAALDHLAWQLVLLENGTPNRGTSFPIYDSNVNKKGQPSPARIAGVHDPRVIRLVEAVQPYELSRLGVDFRTSGVRILNDLVNIDKHRLLLVIAAALRIGGMYWFGQEGFDPPSIRLNPAPLKDGDPVAWFDFHGVEPDPDFDPHLGIEVRLNDGDPSVAVRRPDLRDLVRRLYFAVEHEVVGNTFAPLFGLMTRHGVSI